MNRKPEIEARLDRSLDRQISAPKLDQKFDAAVWSRIEAAESRASQLVVAQSDVRKVRTADLSRWLFVSNVIGVAVAVTLAIYFGARAFGGIGVHVDFNNVAVPTPSTELLIQVVTGVGYVFTLAALGLTVSLTSFGRRLRAQFG
jgi:hypothetical protein